MYGQSSRGFDRRNAYFRPIDDDDMVCSSSSPTSASSPVSFWISSAAEHHQAGGGEEEFLKALHEEAVKDRERMKVLCDFITSERDYVKDLETINSLFLQPLRKRRILPDADVGQLFSTLPAIISLNKALLSAVVGSYTQAEAWNRTIDASVATLVQTKAAGGKGFNAVMTARGLVSLSSVKRKECLVADAFQQMVSYLKVYTTYSTRYVDAMAIIKRHKAANSAFGAFLEEVQGAPECRGRDMKTLMLLPIQRLCQYVGVLDGLVRCTPRTHSDHQILSQTATSVKEVARATEESLLTLQMAAKSVDEVTGSETTRASVSGSRGSSGGSAGRRRKLSHSEDRPARVERRRDSLADMPDVAVLASSNGSSNQQQESSATQTRRPKRQVSWRFSLGRSLALSAGSHKSYSLGDCGDGGESLLSMLERERKGATTGPAAAATNNTSNSTAAVRQSLRRRGSLTRTASISKAPRRVNSSAALCRCESATGSAFKGNLVC